MELTTIIVTSQWGPYSLSRYCRPISSIKKSLSLSIYICIFHYLHILPVSLISEVSPVIDQPCEPRLFGPLGTWDGWAVGPGSWETKFDRKKHHRYDTGWWCNNHLEKYEFVNGKDDIPYMKWKIKNVPNHQPVIEMYTSLNLHF